MTLLRLKGDQGPTSTRSTRLNRGPCPLQAGPGPYRLDEGGLSRAWDPEHSDADVPGVCRYVHLLASWPQADERSYVGGEGSRYRPHARRSRFSRAAVGTGHADSHGWSDEE